ncbi:WGxxGxxG family protein [Paenibacillus sp. Soil522]|uniref:WGxxGxxG family protein n=1 Tax=Paenibacillus sp. Soil522 TaxID=1736388 RepID=UPI0006FF81B9|nr:WGxxGxxG family protein [Paenibacillus sp. Soil522]KRE39797.1 hypothetical protein ASG81_17865 [Paenibacillus sp. Soil522]
MKKFWSIFCVISCLAFVLAVPAFADHSRTGTMENYTNRSMGNAVPDTGLRSDTRIGIDNTTRALDVDNDTRLNTNANMNTNAYRTNAADNDNDFNWSWLGLFGLLGLMGLRNRNRERT